MQETHLSRLDSIASMSKHAKVGEPPPAFSKSRVSL